MVSGPLGGAVHDWRRRSDDQAQRHLDVHVHRTDVECCEPDVRRVLEFLSGRDGTTVRVHRHDGGRGGSGCRTRHHHCDLS